jgi:hypothetical protein
MAQNTKQITRVPLSLSAKTPDELTLKCLENNLRHGAEFHYFQIMNVGKQWMAWYYAELDKYPILKRKKLE